MSHLNINIRDDLRDKVAARAAESGFDSVETYVESLVANDVENVSDDEDLEALLLDRLDIGPGIEMTPTFVEQFKAEVLQRRNAAAGRK